MCNVFCGPSIILNGYINFCVTDLISWEFKERMFWSFVKHLMVIICLFLIKHHIIKTYEDVEVLFHTLLTMEPNGSDSSCTGHTPAVYWIEVWMGPRAGLSMMVKIKLLPLTGIEPWPPRLQWMTLLVKLFCLICINLSFSFFQNYTVCTRYSSVVSQFRWKFSFPSTFVVVIESLNNGK
jgi:hypothetical protein